MDNIGETPERRGEAHMGLPERIDTILNWTELSVLICLVSMRWVQIIRQIPWIVQSELCVLMNVWVQAISQNCEVSKSSETRNSDLCDSVL